MAGPEEPRRVDAAGAVTARRFAVAFRGYDQAEVRAFLAEVQAQLDGWQQRQEALRAELTAVRAEGVAAIDEATIAELVGEEAARLIATARDGAAQIRARAEEEAGRIRDEARAAGAAEAEALVAEAQALRTRMLEDLGARRRAAHTQHDQLCSGREEVLIALTRAQRAVASALEEIRAAVPEALDALDLSTELGVEVAGFELVPNRPDRRIEPMPAAEPEPAPAAEPADAAERDSHAGTEHRREWRPASSPVPAGRGADDVFARLRAERARAVADARQVLARVEPAAPEPSARAHGDDEPDVTPSTAAPAERDHAVLAARDAVLAPVESALARALKRAMADEQNQVLDRLRRRPVDSSVSVLLGDVAGQAQRYRDAAALALMPALTAGLAVGRADAEVDARADARADPGVDAVRDEVLASLERDLVVPLRERTERAITISGGDADEATSRLRSLYREWRAQRLDPLAVQLTLAAHGAATLAGLSPGTPVRWVVDSASACPDADDNALAGAIACGKAFPTGHTHAPAHPGCRCAVIPA